MNLQMAFSWMKQALCSQRPMFVPGVVSQSAPYDDRNYDDSQEMVDADDARDLLGDGDESLDENRTQLYSGRSNPTEFVAR